MAYSNGCRNAGDHVTAYALIRPSSLSSAFGPTKARSMSRGDSHGFKIPSNGEQIRKSESES